MDLAVARHRGHLPIRWVHVHRVAPTFAEDSAADALEMSDQVGALQAAGIFSGSRITS